jgi:hypothetical protein
VLFISGYAADIIHKKGIFESSINFLSKPVTPDHLSEESEKFSMPIKQRKSIAVC